MRASLTLSVQLDDLDDGDFAEGHKTSEWIFYESIGHLFGVYYRCSMALLACIKLLWL